MNAREVFSVAVESKRNFRYCNIAFSRQAHKNCNVRIPKLFTCGNCSRVRRTIRVSNKIADDCSRTYEIYRGSKKYAILESDNDRITCKKLAVFSKIMDIPSLKPVSMAKKPFSYPLE